MSGGVDSSVAAMLTKNAGFEVIAVTMRLFGKAQEKAAWRAAAVAQKLGIEHRVADLSAEFNSRVIDYFCGSYQRGATPNPCVVCNRMIKFGALLNFADDMGAQYLATGHYARSERSATGCHLLKACDASKDQSYFLYRLNQHQLGRTLFPLGGLTKTQTHDLAREAGLPSFLTESQDICFLGGADYRTFLEKHIDFTPGDVVDAAGNALGRHRGLPLYTIGQRQGLGIASARPLYVIAIDPASNRLVVGSETDLVRSTVRIEDITWISGAWPTDTSNLTARIRYRMPDSELISIRRDGETAAILTFREPVRAVTPGQSTVIYRCGEVLGGGIITG